MRRNTLVAVAATAAVITSASVVALLDPPSSPGNVSRSVEVGATSVVEHQGRWWLELYETDVQVELAPGAHLIAAANLALGEQQFASRVSGLAFGDDRSVVVEVSGLEDSSADHEQVEQIVAHTMRSAGFTRIFLSGDWPHRLADPSPLAVAPLALHIESGDTPAVRVSHELGADADAEIQLTGPQGIEMMFEVEFSEGPAGVFSHTPKAAPNHPQGEWTATARVQVEGRSYVTHRMFTVGGSTG